MVETGEYGTYVSATFVSLSSIVRRQDITLLPLLNYGPIRIGQCSAVHGEVGSYRTADIAGSDVDRYQEQRLPLQEGGAGTAIKGAPLPGKDSGIGAGLGHIVPVGVCALWW